MGRKMRHRNRKRRARALAAKAGDVARPDETTPDWTRRCLQCGGTPVLPLSGMSATPALKGGVCRRDSASL
jgi:hypothetical protein